jgi:hypothetical protein
VGARIARQTAGKEAPGGGAASQGCMALRCRALPCPLARLKADSAAIISGKSM